MQYGRKFFFQNETKIEGETKIETLRWKQILIFLEDTKIETVCGNQN